MNPKHIAEAALFMSTEPLSATRLSKIMGVHLADAMAAMDELRSEFNSRNSSLEIVKTAEGLYRMQVRQEFLPKVKDLAVSVDLPKALIRTLSLIAFKQPIKQSDVVKLRGNKAYEQIDELEQQGFIKKSKKGHTFLLETTRKFEEYFQLPGNQQLEKKSSTEKHNFLNK
ncbi:MAG: SMC-Scp complex subunit ScpB [Candidatus Diapherotrites archaeon]|nr:SMC-Scp complex subunit ScpB [Candidatus Diapherotrites archaeon]